MLGLLLTLQLPGELVQATALPASSITVQINNPACLQVTPTSGDCSLQVDSVVATGSDPSFSRLELLVNGKLRVFMGGFFESTAYFTFPMVPGGLKVVCGLPNDGGLPDYGRAYTLTANTFMVDGTEATASSTLYCPAFDGKLFLPLVSK